MTAAGIEDLARQRWGEPNPALSSRKEMRFGRKGSVVVDRADGRWFDHEQQKGGYLVRHSRRDDVPWSRPRRKKPRQRGQLIKRPPVFEPTPITRKTLAACAVWHQSEPLNAYDDDGDAISENGDALPVLSYLKNRKIELYPWPETLAFARLTHPETREENVPALVVARQCPVSGLLRGIQRVFLTEDGEKYPHGTVKMSLGSIQHGRAELIPATSPHLIIAEGVETALAAHILLKHPAWACCGSFPAVFPLPDRVRRVTIVADHDKSGVSEKHARALGAHLRNSCGREVEAKLPTTVGQDMNDVLVECYGN